jgi:hypothetical protein
MAVPYTRLHALALMLQVQSNLTGLQSDFRTNALAWKAAATAQSIPVATIAQQMIDAAAAYEIRLAWIPALQSKTAVWSVVSSLWTAIGGTGAEFSSLMTPFNTVTTQLKTINKSSYDNIITACDSLLAYIDKPESLWPLE